MDKNILQIRVAAMQDAEALLDIYAPYVKNTAVTFEYEVPSVPEFAGRISRVLRKYPYLVAEMNGEILGYAYADTFKERAAYDWVVETSIYVKQNKKRIGIGKKLYGKLEEILYEQGILNLNACIAYPQEEDKYLTKDSVNFHSRFGYRLVGEFHQCGYKFNKWYNMVWMEKHIGEHKTDQPSVKTFHEIKEKIGIDYRI